MKRLLVLCFVVAACFLAAGCSVNASKVDAEYAKDFISKATYIKDAQTGLCFAVVGTRKTMSTDQNGISWTWVPCDQVEKFLVN